MLTWTGKINAITAINFIVQTVHITFHTCFVFLFFSRIESPLMSNEKLIKVLITNIANNINSETNMGPYLCVQASNYILYFTLIVQ